MTKSHLIKVDAARTTICLNTAKIPEAIKLLKEISIFVQIKKIIVPMRNFIFLILLAHGFLHLPWFVRTFTKFNKYQLQVGWYWLVSFFLFSTTAVVFRFDMNAWYYLGMAALLVSQYAIIMNWEQTKTGTLINIIILVLIILTACSQRYFLQHNIKGTISAVVAGKPHSCFVC